ncbi:MAG: ATP-binding cassette domain-containing protein [Rhizobiales bacterium]|nr:ATP-binding cassette domain-containing protein [Hyphomicrobiales bacterium]
MAGKSVTVFALVVLVLAAMPYATSESNLFVLMDVLIAILFATAYNLVLGQTGLLSFGHAAYFGLGAYTVALLQGHLGLPMLVGIAFGPFVAGFFAMLVALLTVRLSGMYFAMLTLAFAQLIYTIIAEWYSFTGGDNGLPVTVPDYFFVTTHYFYLTLGIVAASVFLLWLIVNSPFGVALLAIPDGFPIDALLDRIRAACADGSCRRHPYILRAGCRRGDIHHPELLCGKLFRISPAHIRHRRIASCHVPAGGSGRNASPLGFPLAQEWPRGREGDRAGGCWRRPGDARMSAPILEFDGVSKTFGGFRAVSEIKISLQKGEILAVIGPNGAGSANRLVHRGIARSFQITSIFPRMTVTENVRIALMARRGRCRHFLRPAHRLLNSEVDELLAQVRMQGARNRLAGQLAAGDRKRLEFAIALAGTPSVLLLDEPTAGMSGDERALVVDVLKEVNHRLGLSILFTEHDIDMVFALAQRIAVMHQGALIAEGAPESVRADPRVREVYLGKSHSA